MTDPTALERRIADVGALFDESPPRLEELFARSFLDAVKPDRVRGLVKDLRDRVGALSSIAVDEALGPLDARYRFTFDKGYAVPVTLRIAPVPPHQVRGLLFGPPVRLAADLAAVERELRELPGAVSFLLARIDAAAGGASNGIPAVTPLAAVDPERPLAIGSAFKLYVLAELVRAIENRERQWDDVARLDAADRSLTSGTLQDWPAGSPLTLHTAATLMISASDNTATDLLLRVLGDERVEAVQRRTGHATPERNVPFLSTREMFALTSQAGASLAARWAGADVTTRRALAAESAAIPHGALHLPAAVDGPGAIDRLEWFASARDLVHAMAWLRDHTRDARTAPGRALLAVNPGLRLPPTRWPFVGYKGGSEAGVLNLTFLLQDADGAWYALAATWNDPRHAVDQNDLLPLVQRALELASTSAP